ncbi:multiple epidermal growth factor-like domains protein 10 [Drosophila montana]|uniref:multiple epidermal growth factor-like domains protein 10 n=1 Tax=Drosophila montana TaxID=40370 RepID=UPI00313B8B08
MLPQPVWRNNNVLLLLLVLGFACPMLALNIDLDKPNECDEGAVQSHPDDCARYLQCLNAEILIQKCPNDSYFDPTYEVCVIDVNGVCASASGKCSEDQIEAMPGNSCGYLRCINGSLEEEKCDIGSYFNASLSICEIDENGICSTLPGNCSEGELQKDPEDCAGYLKCVNGSLIEEKCANGSFFNFTLKICEIDENGICPMKCLEGELQEDPEDCAGYLKCINGSLIEEKCSNGSFFNSTLKICAIDENGVCTSPPEKCLEDEIQEIPGNSCGYLRCINGSLEEEKCDIGSYFNASLSICEIDENGICSTLPGNCSEGELQENPENCAGYLKCINGSLVEEKCSNGSFFNITLKVCQIDENGICPIKCLEGELQEDPEDCAGYLKCINGSLIEEKCANGSFFNSTLKICAIDENGVCTSPPEKCLEDEIKEIPGNSCGYLRCINGSLEEEKCDIGSYFNASLSICEIDENGICSSLPGNCSEGELQENPENCAGYLKCINGSLVEEKCSNGSFFNITLKVCQIDENGICPIKCLEGELQEDPEDCAGYLKCINGSLIEEKCANGSFFNSTLIICQIDENGVCTPAPEKCLEDEIKEIPGNSCGYLRCINGSLEEEKCEVGSFFNASLSICEIDENGICPTLPVCLEGQLEEDPEDCSGYLECVNGSYIEQKCASGSFFNSTLQTCEIDDNGICFPIPAKCSEGELEEDPENKCGYLKCLNGILVELICANGSYYNSTLKTCLIDENGICSSFGTKCANHEVRHDPEDCSGYLQCFNGDLVKKLCSYGSYFHTTLQSCVVDDYGICTPLSDQCEEGERETDPDDCAAYMECIAGDFIAQKCVNGTYFDVGIKACILDEKCVCIKQAS